MKQKTEVKIRIILIIILLALNLGIYLNGKALDCNQCNVSFNTDNQQDFEVRLKDIYLYYQNETCLVEATGGGFILREE